MIQEDYSPAWALDYSLLNYRIFCGFLNQALGFDGMLFWRANYYEEANPWVDLSNGYEGNSLADGLLVYPEGAAATRRQYA